MINGNITINAVSPFKKRSKSYKGGTGDKRAATTGKTFAGTKKHARHGGFGKSTKSSNKPGYNIATHFVTPKEKTFPAATVSSPPPAPTKPYSFGPDGGINFHPTITVSPEFNNNPSFVNKNANANAGGTGKSETTTTTESSGHWEHWKKKKVRDDEGGARNACNDVRRTSKYFTNGKNKKGQTFQEECDEYKKHVKKHGHGEAEYESGKTWIPDGTKSTTTTKNTNKGGGNATAINY